MPIPKISQTFDKPLAVMFHGLEGSSDSHYAIAFAHQAHRLGYDAVIVHFAAAAGWITFGELTITRVILPKQCICLSC
ncbi:MAG: hypothetical protein U1E91_01805 [Moraxella sp.]